MNAIPTTPRETPPNPLTPHRVTSWWLEGSTAETGMPLFITEGLLIRADGAQVNVIYVWVSNRPYGVNEKLGTIEGKNHWLLTWGDVFDALERGMGGAR